MTGLESPPRRPVPPSAAGGGLFLAALAGLLALVGWIVGGGAGVAVAGLGAGLALLLGPRLPAAAIMRMLGARRVRPDPWTGSAWQDVARLAAALARRAGMPQPPGLYWQPTAAVRAFSVGDADDPALACRKGR